MHPSENPYSASHQESSVPAPKHAVAKPVSVMVFGILNLVFGIPALLFSPVNLIMIGTIESGEYPANPVWDIMRETPGYMTYYKITIVLGIVMSAVLVASGGGLLAGKPWGRTITIIYSWLAIALSVAGAAGTIYFLWGPLSQLEGPEGMGARIGGIVGGLIGAVLGPVYPILTIIFMNRRIVVEYFRQQQDH